jgi:hypothetical protein
LVEPVLGPQYCDHVSGSVQGCSYKTKPNDTFVWGLTLFDEINLIVKNMCALSSRTFQPISFGFDSTLLQSRRDLVVTSGDALRASGDPNYQKFFNAIQNNPNFPNINEFYSYGPVIKDHAKRRVYRREGPTHGRHGEPAAVRGKRNLVPRSHGVCV